MAKYHDCGDSVARLRGTGRPNNGVSAGGLDDEADAARHNGGAGERETGESETVEGLSVEVPRQAVGWFAGRGGAIGRASCRGSGSSPV